MRQTVAAAAALGALALCALARRKRRRRSPPERHLEAAGVVLSADQRRFSAARLAAFLHGESYWAQDRPLSVIERSAAGSVCVGAYCARSGTQVGGLRVVTDGATTAYLADVYVDRAARGKGMGKALVEFALALPQLADVRRWVLFTRDAHGLYAQFGFEAADSGGWMTVLRPVVSGEVGGGPGGAGGAPGGAV